MTFADFPRNENVRKKLILLSILLIIPVDPFLSNQHNGAETITKESSPFPKYCKFCIYMIKQRSRKATWKEEKNANQICLDERHYNSQYQNIAN